ncbi:MAG: SUMF1/EgtB/PvdO family nonheme iron enzyme [Polyangia bacterium]|jgi:cysteine-rich repeat protein|nr:SUMF1/EgtB/PvdO family nonheme iron enzyme [Polyangia bacterium]
MTIRCFSCLALVSLLLGCGDPKPKPAPDPVCGDGVQDQGEECDDGNGANGDGCSAACLLELAGCPEDMIPIPANPSSGVAESFCVDRFEASRMDATETQGGSALELGPSRAGVMPWVTNPMGPGVLATYQAACAAAGKRLCTASEWQLVCQGPEVRIYAFGDVFDAQTCNCVDTFCEDFCEAHPEITGCPTGSGCGYATYSFQLQPTGQFPDCVSAHGAMDVCGNAWEVVSADNALGYQVRGGAFNCAGAEERLKCTYNATWADLWAGFRCCKAR